jgi:hypothetical protein
VKILTPLSMFNPPDHNVRAGGISFNNNDSFENQIQVIAEDTRPILGRNFHQCLKLSGSRRGLVLLEEMFDIRLRSCLVREKVHAAAASFFDKFLLTATISKPSILSMI